jgi:hypothetical protein
MICEKKISKECSNNAKKIMSSKLINKGFWCVIFFCEYSMYSTQLFFYNSLIHLHFLTNNKHSKYSSSSRETTNGLFFFFFLTWPIENFFIWQFSSTLFQYKFFLSLTRARFFCNLSVSTWEKSKLIFLNLIIFCWFEDFLLSELFHKNWLLL